MPKSRKLRPSSTPGISKGMNCKKTQLKMRLAKDTRFHKTDPLNYANACAETDVFFSVKSETTRKYEQETFRLTGR